MESNSMTIEKLYTRLAGLPTGKIGPETAPEVETLLYEAWDELAIDAYRAGMAGYKLVGRTEGLTWNPPLLEFDIERHGGTIMGSIYGEVQSWQVDVKQGTATYQENKRRLLHPELRAKQLKVEPLAAELATLILGNKKDKRLQWLKDGTVRVLISVALPPSVAWTKRSRTERLHRALEPLLQPHNWKRTRTNIYAKEI